MFVFANFLTTIARLIGVVSFLLSVYTWVIIFRALVSWVNPDPYNQIVQFLQKSTEPLLSPIRLWLIKVFRREFIIDISPMVAILAIWILQIILQNLIAATLIDLAIRIKA